MRLWVCMQICSYKKKASNERYKWNIIVSNPFIHFVGKTNSVLLVWSKPKKKKLYPIRVHFMPPGRMMKNIYVHPTTILNFCSPIAIFLFLQNTIAWPLASRSQEFPILFIEKKWMPCQTKFESIESPNSERKENEGEKNEKKRFLFTGKVFQVKIDDTVTCV